MITKKETTRSNLCVFIGRMEPLHTGHMTVIREGLEKGDFLLVLLGSAHEARSTRNPFTTSERTQMIMEAFDYNPHLIVRPLEDSNYNLTDWLENTQKVVNDTLEHLRATHPNFPQKPTVSLIGHAKDQSSYYLNLFPTWGSIDVAQSHVLSATQLRHSLFANVKMEDMESLKKEKSPTLEFLEEFYAHAAKNAQSFLNAEEAKITQNKVSDFPKSMIGWLRHFCSTENYVKIVYEFAFAAKYRYQWRFAPYEPIFVTADAVVVQSGHILLVKRRAYPGKGLWALPGGFVEANEPIFDACLRELNEETKIKLSPNTLKGCVVANQVFDAPYRSSRGRTITHAYLFHLRPGPLPKTKTGGLLDDEETEKIQWVPLHQLDRADFFEDHYSIIMKMTKLI